MVATLDDRSLPVLTAIANPSLEAALVAGFGRHELGIAVVRRCVDLVELLSAAAAGTARVALVSADLRGLDRESLALMAGYGLAVVGLADSEAGERLLHQLGATLVAPAGASSEQIAGAMLAASEAQRATSRPGLKPPHTGGHPGAEVAVEVKSDAGSAEPGGQLIAVWGPTGAPGRTTLALAIADTLAVRGVNTLLVDADPYGGTIASYAGLLDESPGIAAACRAANAGLLDVARLAECCRELSPRLRVLTGLSHGARWPELRPASLEVVLELARRVAAVTVIDVGFCLEDDEELSYDALAPRRNAATLTSLRAADQIVVVAAADPTGIARLVRELPRLAEVLGEPLADLVGAGRVTVVVNRVRAGLLPGNPLASVTLATRQHAGLAPAAGIPLDTAAADAAHGRGQLLSEAAPQSSLVKATYQLTAALWPFDRRTSGSHKKARKSGNRTSKRARANI